MFHIGIACGRQARLSSNDFGCGDVVLEGATENGVGVPRRHDGSLARLAAIALFRSDGARHLGVVVALEVVVALF